MDKIITSALIYANGEVHLGHLVEYIQTDIFTRYLSLNNDSAFYFTADDTHGTPIQVNAEKMGITPEKLIEKSYNDHISVLRKFNINFAQYHSTNSPENREIVEFIYSRIKENGFIYEKTIESTYCEHCKRFLPDRYIKGKCPKCKAEDQYGDSCEKCNATYKPSDLIEPYCTICGSKPVLKETKQLFFKLSLFNDQLKKYIMSITDHKTSFRNYLLNWIDEGLKDWEISRDEPYFGFKIPETENKYFYVWFDAPIGYIATSKKYFDKKNVDWKSYWIENKGEIYHFIGKDIIYHHFLFWPAILMAAGFSLPKKIVVHGFLNINGEKMSKSRGTFVTAQDFAKKNIPADYLRAYFTGFLTPYVNDFNYSDKDFTNFINDALIGKFGNLIYRASTFLYKNFSGKTGNSFDPDLLHRLSEEKKEIFTNFLQLDYKKGFDQFFKIIDVFNKYFQDNEPWNLIKKDREKTLEILTTTITAINELNILISPVMPDLSLKVAENFNSAVNYSESCKPLLSHSINPPLLIFNKIEENFSIIQLSPAVQLDLKVGRIAEISDHPDADKLYVCKIDFKNEQRQIIAGLKAFYSKEELLNKNVIVLCNLKPSKLRGLESQGMILAAGDTEGQVGVLTSEDASPGTPVKFEGLEYPSDHKIITYKEFEKISIKATEEGIFFDQFKLCADKLSVHSDKKIYGTVS